MKKLALLLGLLTIVAAGTTSAQTRVAVSIGFGVPRPYVAGGVFIGRPFLRPVYRPYCYRCYEPRRVVVIEERPFYDRDTRVIVVRPRRFHRHRHRWGW